MEVNIKLQTRHLSAADDKIQFKSTKKVAEELNEAVAYRLQRLQYTSNRPIPT